MVTSTKIIKYKEINLLKMFSKCVTFALVIFSFFRIENANTAGLHVDE